MPGWLTVFDTSLLGWLAAQRSPGLDSFFSAITWLGSLWLIAPLAIMMAWLSFCSQQRRAGLLLIFSPLVVGAASFGLKLLIDRARPDLFPTLNTLPTDPSFPSAHAAQAVAFALAAVLAWRGMGNRVPPWLGIVALVYVVSIALSRLYLQVHFPSDVIGGWLLGVAGVFVVRAALSRLVKTEGDGPSCAVRPPAGT